MSVHQCSERLRSQESVLVSHDSESQIPGWLRRVCLARALSLLRAQDTTVAMADHHCLGQGTTSPSASRSAHNVSKAVDVLEGGWGVPIRHGVAYTRYRTEQQPRRLVKCLQSV